MPDPAATRSAAVRERILGAAAAVLTKDTGASLADIAAAAGVGRTTVHRHFPTRESLLVALGLDAVDRVSRAIEEAQPDDGPVPAVLGRVVERVLPLADELRYLDLGPDLWRLPELSDAWYPLAQTVDAIVLRGQREGDLRPDLPAALVSDLLVGAVWCIGDSVAEGRVARGDAARGVLTVLLHGAAAVPDRAP